MIITIDGPSGTGKSTVARQVAKRLHFIYFDTGAMYRAFTWFVLKNGVNIQDPKTVKNYLEAFDFKIEENQDQKHYFVGAVDVTEEIRSKAVTEFVSTVAALPIVRSHLLSFQHRFAKKHSAVFEGRDLGTVVFPEAEIKIYLDAEPKVRAERRLKELLLKNPEFYKNLKPDQMMEALLRRDQLDSTRKVAPLRCASDAHKIDTTHLSIDQVVNEIVNYCLNRFPNLIKS